MNIPFEYKTQSEFNYESTKDIHGRLWKELKARYHKTQMMAFAQDGFSFLLTPKFTSARIGFDVFLKSGEIRFNNYPNKIIIDYQIKLSLFPFLLPIITLFVVFASGGEKVYLLAFTIGISLMVSFFIVPFVWLFFLKAGDIKCMKKELLKRN